MYKQFGKENLDIVHVHTSAAAVLGRVPLTIYTAGLLTNPTEYVKMA